MKVKNLSKQVIIDQKQIPRCTLRSLTTSEVIELNNI
ncbi:hypothetical protein MiSe_36340 [Microseira wollei NIES-4236]|uniref:Uncharacterized protein n=1 Tax=Microseira wollei NIES-4236 TaxID=2530354 RepID=A0AAV3XFH9_9CYAN|nr:hypothetical protein MiSe_36340 [Microseira wollei NIES-4236]